MDHWFVASYKIKEIKTLEKNLKNQSIDYYLPKITKNKINNTLKEEVMFPGYIFIKTSINKFSAVKYTKGIRNIIKFGNNFSYISDKEIKILRGVELLSKSKPLNSKINIGGRVYIKSGSLKGNIAKINSLPSKERIEVLLYFLGSNRRAIIPQRDLAF